MTVWQRMCHWITVSKTNGQTEVFPCERVSRRFDTHLLVSWSGNSNARETKGNVGIGGFCFETDQVPRIGSSVDLLIDLPGSDHFVMACGEVLGVIICSDHVAVRGRFTRIAFEDERRLARWIDSLQAVGQAA